MVWEAVEPCSVTCVIRYIQGLGVLSCSRCPSGYWPRSWRHRAVTLAVTLLSCGIWARWRQGSEWRSVDSTLVRGCALLWCPVISRYRSTLTKASPLWYCLYSYFMFHLLYELPLSVWRQCRVRCRITDELKGFGRMPSWSVRSNTTEFGCTDLGKRRKISRRIDVVPGDSFPTVHCAIFSPRIDGVPGDTLAQNRRCPRRYSRPEYTVSQAIFSPRINPCPRQYSRPE
jgi:hypothetical protein